LRRRLRGEAKDLSPQRSQRPQRVVMHASVQNYLLSEVPTDNFSKWPQHAKKRQRAEKGEHKNRTRRITEIAECMFARTRANILLLCALRDLCGKKFLSNITRKNPLMRVGLFIDRATNAHGTIRPDGSRREPSPLHLRLFEDRSLHQIFI